MSKNNAINQGCMLLSTDWLEYGRGHLAQLRRSLAYATKSNSTSHDNRKNINSWVSFLYENGAPLGCASGRRSSATISIH